MDPVAGFATYLEKIDWQLAFVAGVLAVTAALLLKRFLEPAADQLVALALDAQARVANRLLESRGDIPTLNWACPACRSVNAPATSFCYRCTAARPEDSAIPTAVGENERAIQRAGRTGRRG